MADISWLIKRLKAMSIPEVAWRLNQKIICKNEEKKYCAPKVRVTNRLFNVQLRELKIDEARMHLNINNHDFNLTTSIPLLGNFNYSNYKKKWHAGFQTPNDWPMKISYLLEYKQRDDIGDARTNWELNRHFQFALLAKNYAASRDKKYLDEFTQLFKDWNEKNPFCGGYPGRASWRSQSGAAIGAMRIAS